MEFGPAKPINYTLNRQGAIRRFQLRDKIRKDNQKVVLKSECALPEDDLLSTNQIQEYQDPSKPKPKTTTPDQLGLLPTNLINERYFQENYSLVNISSRQRNQYYIKTVTLEDRMDFPNQDIFDEYYDPETGNFGDLLKCSSTFNNVLGLLGQDLPCYFAEGGKLKLRIKNDTDTNQYRVNLNPVLKNVRTIRLVSAEIPLTINNITPHNNLLMLDVIDPCTGQSFDFDTDLPFMLLLIPPGDYDVPQLLETITALLNCALQCINRSSAKCPAFGYKYVPETGEIEFMSKYKFHLKFWFSCTEAQFNVWDMLGFPGPYPMDENRNPVYVKVFSNLVDRLSPLGEIPGLMNRVPAKRPSMDIYSFIYLIVKELGVLRDTNIPDGKEILAKVFLSEPQKLISGTKVFDVPVETIERFDVEWVDEYGQLVDFGGRDNSFTLQILEYVDKLKRVDYNSQRGTRNYEDRIPSISYGVNVDMLVT